MDVIRICSELVRIRSENPPGKTDEVIAYIRSVLDNLGISSQEISGKPGFCNLVSAGNASGLMFCGHVDVVPAIDEGWEYPPFSGVIADGCVVCLAWNCSYKLFVGSVFFSSGLGVNPVAYSKDFGNKTLAAFLRKESCGASTEGEAIFLPCL